MTPHTAQVDILYREIIEKQGPRLPGGDRCRITDRIEVEVRKWVHGSRIDVVGHWLVLTEGRLARERTRLMPEGKADAQYIRLGLALFDNEVLLHPAFCFGDEGAIVCPEQS